MIKGSLITVCRFGLLLIVVVFNMLHASVVYAQSKPAGQKREAKEKRVSLKAALEKLENHYHVDLVYLDQDLPDIIVYPIRISGVFMDDLEKQLIKSGLKPTKISGKQFVLNKQVSLRNTDQDQHNWVEGKVYTLNDHIALADATITATVSGKTTHSDQHGYFKLYTKKNETVRIDYLGYKPQSVILTTEHITPVFLVPEQIRLNDVEIFSNTDFIDYIKRSDIPLDRQRAQLYQTGRTSLPQSLNFSYANINVGHYAIDNVASYLDPVRLNGQDADYIVVLIEGKRRHLFSGLNLNYTTGMGYSGVDLEAIPQNLLQKIEVIPADQNTLYGSDGIGGIINFKFDRQFRGFNFRQTNGVTSRGDGLTSTSGLLYGTALPWSKASFLTLSMTYKNQQSTDRANTYSGLVYRSAKDTAQLSSAVFTDASQKITENKRLDDSVVSNRNFDRNVSRYGDGKRNNISFWYNTSSPVSRYWKLYSFGGVSSRHVRTYGFYRFPNDYKSASSLYPDGYLPEDPATLNDVAFTVGLAGKAWHGYHIDLSRTYGKNSFKSATEHTVNPSMGISSPTSFNLGQTLFGESVNDLTISKAFKWRKNIHLSAITMGSQFINRRYQIKAGDEGSYLDANPAGTQEDQLKLSGTNGHLGFSPSNAVSAQQRLLSLYIQARFFIDNYTDAGAGIRYEKSSLFNAQLAVSGDIRRNFGDDFTVHAAYNQSAKLPSLQQLYFSQTQYQFFPRNGISDVYKIMQVNSFAPIRNELGISDLKPERIRQTHFSVNYKKDHLSLWLSYNKIKMKDRLMVSDLLVTQNESYANILRRTAIDAVQYFRNIPGSRTQIVQLIGTYDLTLSRPEHNLGFEGHFAYNRTHVNNGNAVQEHADPKADRIFKGIIEDGQPKVKIIGKVNYQTSLYSIYLRNTWFGPVWYRDNSPELDQYFGGKIITDIGAGYQQNKSLVFTLSFNNLLNIYPDRVVENTALNTNRTFGNQIVYSRQTSQFGIYGTYVSVTINYKF